MAKKQCYQDSMTEHFDEPTFANMFNEFSDKFNFEASLRDFSPTLPPLISQSDMAMWGTIMTTFFVALLKREVSISFARDVAEKFLKLRAQTAWTGGDIDMKTDYVSITLNDRQLRLRSYARLLLFAHDELREEGAPLTPESLRSRWLRIIHMHNVDEPEAEQKDIEEDFGYQIA
jgi:hypothetical protein